MIYKLVVKIGYRTLTFPFRKLEDAGAFAADFMEHYVPADDEMAEYAIEITKEKEEN